MAVRCHACDRTAPPDAGRWLPLLLVLLVALSGCTISVSSEPTRAPSTPPQSSVDRPVGTGADQRQVDEQGAVNWSTRTGSGTSPS